MDWKQIVGSVAPTIATALGGPLAGAATSAIASALGCDPKDVAKAVSSASPELLAAMKKADQDFQVRMAELGLEPEKLAAADRASARDREAKLGDPTPRNLAYATLLGFFILLGVQGWLAVQGIEIPAGAQRSLDVSTGVLFAMVIAVKDYYFGTSASSKAKDDHIAHMWDTSP